MEHPPGKDPTPKGRNLTPPSVDVTDELQRTAPDSELRKHGVYFFGENGSPYQEELNNKQS